MRYRTIVADPPWPIDWATPRTRVNGRGERHPNHTRELGYERMDVDSIAALSVPAADDAHLYLWTTDRFLLEGAASHVICAWGFTPTRCLIWRKPSWGLGRCWRPQHEIVVFARRGYAPLPALSVSTVHDWKQPYIKTGGSVAKQHSAKPDAFYDLVEQVSPSPYLELFARRARFGWDYWGDESLQTVSLTDKGERYVEPGYDEDDVRRVMDDKGERE